MPFDTIKVRLQSQSTIARLYSGPLDCLIKTVKSEGIVGLYRGISAPLLGAMLENATLFLCYNRAVEFLRTPGQELPFSNVLLAGAVSGAACSFVLTPIELIKIRVQTYTMTGGIGRTNVLVALKEVLGHGGLLSLYRGQMGTLLRETGGSAAWFGSYEAVSKALSTDNEDSLSISKRLVAGACAGVAYNVSLFPADVVKSQQQSARFGHQGFLDTGKALWKAEGLAGLYRGCGITALRAAPSSAIIFTVYEALKAELTQAT